MAWLIKQTIDLQKGSNAGDKPQSIRPLAYPGNENAHRWEVTVMSNGFPGTLTGYSASAEFDRQDGNRVASVSHGITGNVAWVEFPADVYAVEGIVKARLSLSKSGEDAVIAAITFRVQHKSNGPVVDPGGVITLDVAQLVAEIDAAVASIPETWTELSDEVYDLKSEIQEITDVEWFSFTPGVYYYISPTGTTSQLTPTELAGYAGVLIPCQQGDVFRLNIHSASGSHQRGFVVLDEDKNVLTTSYTDRDYLNYVLDLSEDTFADAAYLLVNNDCVAMPTGYYVIKGQLVGKRLDALEADVAGLETSKQDVLTFDAIPTAGSTNPVTSGGVYKDSTKMKGYIQGATGARIFAFEQGAIVLGQPGDTVTPTPDASTDTLKKYGCVYTPIAPGQTVKYYMHVGSTSYRNWAFLDANNKIISKAAQNDASGYVTLTAPFGSAYLVLNSSLAINNDIWAMALDQLPWSGLYVSLLGDSISALNGYIPSGNDAYYNIASNPSHSGITKPSEMWWGQVINALGGTPLIIDAWSGSTVCKGIAEAGKMAMVDVSRCNNLHAYVPAEAGTVGALLVVADSPSDGEVAITGMRTSPFLTAYTPQVGDYVRRIDPDIVIVEGGGNDFSDIVSMDQIGTYDGHTEAVDPYGAEAEETNFREAYATMLTRIHAKYPLALPICCNGVFFCRPNASKYKPNQRWIKANASDASASVFVTYQDFMDAIEEIAFLYACPVIDFYRNGFSRYNYYGADGAGFASDRETTTTHPNKNGMTVIANNAIPKFREVCNGFVQWLRESRT